MPDTAKRHAKADFHNHSTASDGKLTPTQIVDLDEATGRARSIQRVDREHEIVHWA